MKNFTIGLTRRYQRQKMREVRLKRAFKQDVRRAEGGRYRLIVKRELWEVVDTLARDIPLPYSYHDHPLHGDREGSRDCHIRPDFVLLYRYEDDDVLILERLGSHSEILWL